MGPATRPSSKLPSFSGHQHAFVAFKRCSEVLITVPGAQSLLLPGAVVRPVLAIGCFQLVTWLQYFEPYLFTHTPTSPAASSLNSD
ncbi:hypothetical protein O9992_07485 [Vibrio lentus]|nr:hypothetical protein [Vibrio lentus]